jgi:hypothetical protein
VRKHTPWFQSNRIAQQALTSPSRCGVLRALLTICLLFSLTPDGIATDSNVLSSLTAGKLPGRIAESCRKSIQVSHMRFASDSFSTTVSSAGALEGFHSSHQVWPLSHLILAASRLKLQRDTVVSSRRSTVLCSIQGALHAKFASVETNVERPAEARNGRGRSRAVSVSGEGARTAADRASASTSASGGSARTAADRASASTSGKGARTCKDCGGSSLCEHARIRSKCKNCRARPADADESLPPGLEEHQRRASRHDQAEQIWKG